jgi:hypothetical protein
VNVLEQNETRFSTRGRALSIGAITLPLFAIHFADPRIVSQWLPFPTSCGAITGLPCLFCGMTRALHLLLRGDFAGAFYFNWLAFPFLAAIIFLIVIFGFEIAMRRELLNWRALRPRNTRQITICALGAIVLWSLHAWFAVSQHKHELLNPRGPLYHLFVRN